MVSSTTREGNMAIGTVNGHVVSTEGLEVGMMVTVDHEPFLVEAKDQKDGHYVVNLVPAYGPAWPLEVSKEDYTEPMWELA
jgi:hypothetical protein